MVRSCAMGVLEDVLSLAGEHCDLEQRVKSVPPSAMVRGVLFRNIDSRLAGAGKQAQYRELIGGRQFSALRFYPATEYLQCLVAGGAVLASPDVSAEEKSGSLPQNPKSGGMPSSASDVPYPVM